jgi:LmbE family N-acetylglucosaminyl deacetylase
MKALLRFIRTLLGSKPKQVTLFVGAHPDDEIHMAGLIQAGDVILIATNATNLVRSQEMRTAANYLGCKLIHLELEHPFTELPAAIAVARMHHKITRIVTLDPEHGNYGDNHEHLSLAAKVIEFANKYRFPEKDVLFCTQVVHVPKRFGDFSNAVITEPERIEFVPGRGTIVPLDSQWSRIAQLIQIHGSQFDAEIYVLFMKAHSRVMSYLSMDKWLK